MLYIILHWPNTTIDWYQYKAVRWVSNFKATCVSRLLFKGSRKTNKTNNKDHRMELKQSETTWCSVTPKIILRMVMNSNYYPKFHKISASKEFNIKN